MHEWLSWKGRGRLARVDPTYERIYAAVARIPRGRVATYGEVAAAAGLPGRARQVGYALHALPEARAVPWHRVVNARGEVSPRAEPRFETIQRKLLEREGVTFDARGRVVLARFGGAVRRASH
jgi:methylated-DNA-protein-cysteine methyltransferase-like protein